MADTKQTVHGEIQEAKVADKVEVSHDDLRQAIRDATASGLDGLTLGILRKTCSQALGLGEKGLEEKVYKKLVKKLFTEILVEDHTNDDGGGEEDADEAADETATAEQENDAEEDAESEPEPESPSEEEDNPDKDEDWQPDPEPAKKAKRKRRRAPARRSKPRTRQQPKKRSGRRKRGVRTKRGAASTVVDISAFDTAHYYNGTCRTPLETVSAVVAGQKNTTVNIDARLRQAVDPRSGKYGSTHVVEDESGAFDALLGMQWRGGATRVVGLQLLEADDVAQTLVYESEMREQVWWVFSCEVTATPRVPEADDAKESNSTNDTKTEAAKATEAVEAVETAESEAGDEKKASVMESKTTVQLFPFYDLAAAKQYFSDAFYNKTGHVFGLKHKRKTKQGKYCVLPIASQTYVKEGATVKEFSHDKNEKKEDDVKACDLVSSLVKSNAPKALAAKLGLNVAVFDENAADTSDQDTNGGKPVSVELEIRAMDAQLNLAVTLLSRLAHKVHVNEPVPSDVCDSLQSAVKALLVTDAPVSAGSLQEAIENESCFNNTAGLQRLAGRLCAVDECLRGLRIQRRFRNNCESLETDSARVAVLHKLSHSVSIAELKVPSGEDLPSSEARSDGADKKNDDDDDDDDDDEVPDTLWAACDECDKWRVVDPESHEALEAGGDDAKFHCGDVDKECEDRQLDDVEGAELFRDMIFKATGKKAKPQKKTSKKREGKKAATIRRRAARKYERIRELVSSSLALATKPGQGGISVNAVFEVSRHDEPKTMAAFDNLSAASLGIKHPRQLLWIGTSRFNAQGLAWLCTGVSPPPFASVGMGIRFYQTASGALADVLAQRRSDGQSFTEAPSCLLFLCEVVVGRTFTMSSESKRNRPFASLPGPWLHSATIEPVTTEGVDEASLVDAVDELSRSAIPTPTTVEPCYLPDTTEGLIAFVGGKASEGEQEATPAGIARVADVALHRSIEVFDAAQVRSRFVVDVRFAP